MRGCPSCKTEQTAIVGGRRVCYYCGGELQDIEPEPVISLGEDVGGETVGDAIDEGFEPFDYSGDLT